AGARCRYGAADLGMTCRSSGGACAASLRNSILNIRRKIASVLPDYFLPYTFFLLNGDMALNKNRHIFVHNRREKSQTQLQETDSTAIATMHDPSPALFCAQRTSIDDP